MKSRKMHTIINQYVLKSRQQGYSLRTIKHFCTGFPQGERLAPLLIFYKYQCK